MPSFRGLTKIRYPHLWQDLPVEPASAHAMKPQLTHL